MKQVKQVHIQRRQVLAVGAAHLGLGIGLGLGGAVHATERRDADARIKHEGAAHHQANALQGVKPLELMPLPFAIDALTPILSSTTMQLHHGKHHQAYVDFLKRAEAASAGSISSLSLVDLVLKAHAQGGGPLFNNSAQHYNHCVQWLSLHPKGGGTPPKAVADALGESFGSTEQFLSQWTDKAVGIFGSGWLWLVHDARTGKLQMVSTSNADTPITTPGLTVLATIDVWEHAYYVDYPAARKAYVQAVMQSAFNWRLVEHQLARATDHRRSRGAPNT